MHPLEKAAGTAAILTAILTVLVIGAAVGDSIRVSRAQSIQQGEVMATISTDGTVFVDWDVVRATARGNGPNGSSPILVTAAKIILAVRNGTAKPMPK